MAKKKNELQPKPKKEVKSAKELKKELEKATFGQKQTKALRAQLKKLDILEQLQKKEQMERQKDMAVRSKGAEKKTDRVDKTEQVVDVPRSAVICRYLMDALHDRTFSREWKCPDNCGDVHEMDEHQNVEDFLEMQRCKVVTDRMVSKEEYEQFVERREREESMHRRRKECIRSGVDMFRDNPGIFEHTNDV